MVFVAVFQAELDTAQQQISLLTQQKELLSERLETMIDYPSLKKEKMELQGQLGLLKKQLEEAQEENCLLRAGEDGRCSHVPPGSLEQAAVFPRGSNWIRVYCL